MKVNAFCVGDRIVRREDVFNEDSRLMHGTVTRRYSNYSESELYEVFWDEEFRDTTTRAMRDKGYLPHGLELET